MIVRDSDMKIKTRERNDALPGSYKFEIYVLGIVEIIVKEKQKERVKKRQAQKAPAPGCVNRRNTSTACTYSVGFGVTSTTPNGTAGMNGQHFFLGQVGNGFFFQK